MTSDTQYVATLCVYKEIRIWNVREQEVKAVVKSNDAELVSIAFTSDKKFFVIAFNVFFRVLKMRRWET